MTFDLKRLPKNQWFLSWVFLFSLLLIPHPIFAFFGGKINSFSADQIMISPDGEEMGTSKLYVTPEAYRMDGLPGGDPQGRMANMTVISYKDQNKQYIYNHDKKLVYESSMDESAMMKDLKAFENVDKEKILGKEKVNGYSCVKKQITTTNAVMGMKITSTSIIWQSDQIDFPLRIKSEEGNMMELRNIDTDEPSKKMFTPLSGYKKVDHMMAVMGMDFSAMMEEDNDLVENDMHGLSQQNIEDVDIDEMMAQMEQIMGQNADPEQMAQMKQAMNQAFSEVKQMDMNKGAADGLWQIIPKRQGDQVGSELKTSQSYNVVLGTNSSFNDVCDYYEKQLPARGWKSNGKYIQDGQGFANFSKGEDTLMIGSAEDPGMTQKFKCHYNLQLSSPNM